MGTPATGTVRSLKDKEKTPTFMFLATLTLMDVVAVSPPAFCVVNWSTYVPLSNIVGSSVPSFALLTAPEPVARVVNVMMWESSFNA